MNILSLRRAMLSSLRLRFLVIVTVSVAFPATGIVSAAEKTGTALDFAPVNTAFFTSLLRNREQFDLVVNSQAFARLKSLPAVAQMWNSVRAELTPQPDADGDSNPLQKLLEDPANLALIPLVTDAASNEVFILGDEGFVELGKLFVEATTVARLAGEKSAKEHAKKKKKADDAAPPPAVLPDEKDKPSKSDTKKEPDSEKNDGKETSKTSADGASKEPAETRAADSEVPKEEPGTEEPKDEESADSQRDREMVNAVLELLQKNRQVLHVPHLLLGARISRSEGAIAQIKRLEAIAGPALDQLKPGLGERLRWQKIAGNDFLTLTLDGSLIPWDEIPKVDPKHQPLLDDLKKETLVVSLGVRDGYLLLSAARSTDVLAELGKGKLLIDSPELRPLAKHRDRRITSLNYLSAGAHQLTTDPSLQIDNTVTSMETLEQLFRWGSDDEDDVLFTPDIRAIADDIKTLLPTRKAFLSLSFLSHRGIESFSYDYSHYPRSDATRPLSLLQHLGGSPLLAYVGRNRAEPRRYDMFARSVERLYRTTDRYVKHENKESTKLLAQWENFKKHVVPLAVRADKVTRMLLLPSVADGQVGVVLDAKIASKRWITLQEPTEKALPMIELALLFGVSDEAKLRRAFSEYYKIGNNLLDLVEVLQKAGESDEGDDDLPDEPRPLGWRIPEPEMRKVRHGTMFSYPLPAAAGIDPQITPNAGVNSVVAVISSSPKQTERLLAETPLRAGGPFDRAGQPLGTAFYFDFASTVEAVRPWIELGVASAMNRKSDSGEEAPPGQLPRIREPGADSPELRKMLEQLNVGLESLKVLRTISATTYMEDEITVTHGEIHFRDLPAPATK